MRHIIRPLLVVVLVLLVPILPFLAVGDRLEAWTLAWFAPPPPESQSDNRLGEGDSPILLRGLRKIGTVPGGSRIDSDWLLAIVAATILATDIFLPVPSSLVGTLAGAHLGIVVGAVACWIGLTVGGVVGFVLSRRWGRPLAERFCSADDRAAFRRVGEHWGAWLVAATRPLPVLAEATVLLLGTTDLAWRRFLPALALSNLGLSLVYAALGRLAVERGELPLALAASVALPLVATVLARRFGRNRIAIPADATIEEPV